MSSDPGVELERGHDLAPIRADALREPRQRIGNGHGGDETAVDRDFCKLRALVAHGQDRTAEGTKQRRERLGEGLGGIRAPDHVALGAGSPLDRASKHQGLDLIEQTFRRKRQTAGEARRHLA